MTRFPFKIETRRLPVERIERDFAVVDVKGRRIGARVTIEEETRTESDDGIWRSEWVGAKFSAEPGAMRGGERFGAYAGRRYFDTLVEARAWAETYFAGAEKRAFKNKA